MRVSQLGSPPQLSILWICWTFPLLALLTALTIVPLDAAQAYSFAHKQIEGEASNYQKHLKRFKPKSRTVRLPVLLKRADGLLATDARSAASVYATAVAL